MKVVNIKNSEITASDLVDLIYPVGSIYLTVSNESPANLFGGSWTKMSGGYLYGCNLAPGNNNIISYGEPVAQSHTLTIDEIPAHTHNWKGDAEGGSGSGNTAYFGGNLHTCSGTGTGIQNTGGGQGHTHNIPYIGVWIWKRIS